MSLRARQRATAARRLLPAALALLLRAAAPTVSAAAASVVQSLYSDDGSDVSWRLTNANGSIAVPARVPGAAHLDLAAAGLAGEPYAALNVDAQDWVMSEAAWTFTATFTAEDALLAAPAIELVAEGIETACVVSLNGARLWTSTSAFRRMSADVKAALRAGAGANTLVVAIASPLATAAANFASCTGFCPPLATSPNETAAVGFNYLRAPAVSFGWDFAPHFVGSGIWRPIFLRGYAGAALDDVTVVTTPQALPVPRGAGATAAWTADFAVWATGATASGGATVTVDVAISGGAGGASARGVVLAGPVSSAVQVSVSVPAALAWWPAGLGAPQLYNATVTLTADEGSTSTTEFEFGFRTVALEQPKAPGTGGGSLYIFAVNGVRFFAKGANWVPTDAFPSRIAAPENLLPKLEALVDAKFNTVRVWGGGHPQSSPFYEAAARLGLLLWHEMPFACQSYPASGVPGLLDTVEAEARDIVRRLQKAPIVAWGGNNEIGQIQRYAPGSPGSLNYSALFFGAVRAGVRAVDASRPFVVSSPGSAAETPEEPVANPPQQPALGDMHVYVYGGDCWDTSNYPSARAVSEFGWQAWSSFPSLAELVDPAEYNYWSPQVMRRDTHPSQPAGLVLFHNVGSNWLIPGYNLSSPLAPTARYSRLTGAALAAAAAARQAGQTSTSLSRRADGSYALPTDALGVPAMLALAPGGVAAGTAFRDQLHASQLAQAACVRAEAEHYRRGEGGCLADPLGTGCTMVSLIWMAADLWPGATKGSLEWGGRPKALHYNERRFYAPVLLSMTARPASALPPAQSPFSVFLSAHPPAAAAAAGVARGRLELQCWSWAAGRVGAASTPFSVAAFAGFGAEGGSAQILGNMSLADALASCGCAGAAAAEECVLAAEAWDDAQSPPALLAASSFYPSPLRSVTTMRDPGLAVAAVEPIAGAPGAFNLTLTAARLPAAAVWLESMLCCGRFSDNDFLMTSSPVFVTYTPGADARGWAHAPPPGAERNVTAGQFAASLVVLSLLDTAGYGGGGGGGA